MDIKGKDRSQGVHDEKDNKESFACLFRSNAEGISAKDVNGVEDSSGRRAEDKETYGKRSSADALQYAVVTVFIALKGDYRDDHTYDTNELSDHLLDRSTCEKICYKPHVECSDNVKNIFNGYYITPKCQSQGYYSSHNIMPKGSFRLP